MTKIIKDKSASIRARLLIHAKQSGEEYQRTLTRFAIERLLFRLSQSRITEIAADGVGYQLTGDGWRETFDLVIGADGAWSRVRPLLSSAVPAYEGVTLIELGFDTERHPGVDALTGTGKMFAVGDNRALITQRNGFGHIRGYAGLRVREAIARQWQQLSTERLRTTLRHAFDGWAPSLVEVIDTGEILGVRPLHALPIGHRWKSREGLTLLRT